MRCFCGKEMVEQTINKCSYFSCKSCGYLRKKQRITMEEEKERYDLHICDSGYWEYMHKVAEQILPHVYGLCLDYGCGQVHALSDILNSLGFSTEYYDLYYYPKLGNKKYNTIILIEVFEHVLDVLSLMKELKNQIMPGGKIIIMTQVKKEPLEKWWYLRDVTHFSFVENRTMEKLAEQLQLRLYMEKNYFVFQKGEDENEGC